MRSGSGDSSFSLMVPSSRSVRLKPLVPVSMPRKPFCSASLKVRPIAMTSPTDFIWVPRSGLASANFSKAQRGIFTTT